MIFIVKERNDYSAHYSDEDGARHLFIYNDYFNDVKFGEFKSRVLAVKGHKIVYVFSLDNFVDETLFEKGQVELKAIPTKIYEMYKELAKSIRRGE